MEHRVISITLNEHDWQALMRLHPQPVVWLHEKIQESLAGAGAIASASAAGAANTTSATTR